MRRRAQPRGRPRGPPDGEDPRSHRLDQDQAGPDGGLQTPPGLSVCQEIKHGEERVEKRNKTGANSFADVQLIFISPQFARCHYKFIKSLNPNRVETRSFLLVPVLIRYREG